MKSRILAASSCFLSLPLTAFGDTFVMKDGTTVEGSILREDATSYVVEVNVTKTIKDERILAKADVTKVQREQPDLIAFESIAKLVPAPDFLSSDDYAKSIRKVEAFLKEHVGSSKSREAKAILATLKAEANEVLTGGVKMGGKIIPQSEYHANAYELDARIQEAKIRALVKESKFLPALRAYSDFDRTFRNTSSNTALIPLMIQVINTYLADVSQSLSTLDARIKERQIGLDRMPAGDRQSTQSAIAEENAAIEARFKAEKDAKLGWVTLHPFFKPALDDTMTYGKQELTRLNTLKSAPAVDGGKVFRDALSTIQSKSDASAMTTAINQAKTALIGPKYIEILETAARNAGLKR
jgi:hypothetical protein